MYNYSVTDIEGKKVSLQTFRNKVLLIVNTATGCGFTPQYEGLQYLYEKYKAKGFEILDFPCNQFGSQAPGSDKEIKDFCQLTYNTSFNTFAKIDVNGKNEEPLYTYLKKQKGGLLGSRRIKWNFTKFLIDQQGNVIKRYGPTVKPDQIEKDIQQYLN